MSPWQFTAPDLSNVFDDQNFLSKVAELAAWQLTPPNALRPGVRDVVLDLNEVPGWRDMESAQQRIIGKHGPILFDAVTGEAKVNNAKLKKMITEGLKARADEALPELVAKRQWRKGASGDWVAEGLMGQEAEEVANKARAVDAYYGCVFGYADLLGPDVMKARILFSDSTRFEEARQKSV